MHTQACVQVLVAALTEVDAAAKRAGCHPQEAADTIIAMGETWITVGIMIERARMTFKTRVNRAVDVEEIRQAVEDANQAMTGIAVLKESQP